MNMTDLLRRARPSALALGTAIALMAPVTMALAQEQKAVAPPNLVVYEGDSGPGLGKHIVLIAGDHEYRSEEILPALARILARHYGFRCSVLFTLDEEGFIDPGSSRIDGLEALKTADLMVVGLRFQNFPDAQMQHFVDYLDRAGPVVGIRTSTHAFNNTKGAFAKYSHNYSGEDYPGGFGDQVLGETWVGHYGKNHQQSSRLELEPDAAKHPALRGVEKVHVVCGGYKAFPPDDATVLARGVVLNGMDIDSPPDPTKEHMPVAWTRVYPGAGEARGRVFATTHGASEDFLNPGFRRLMVNGCLWALGLEDTIKKDGEISFVGPYHPSTFSFGGYRRQVRPSDMTGWSTPIMDPEKPVKD